MASLPLREAELQSRGATTKGSEVGTSSVPDLGQIKYTQAILTTATAWLCDKYVLLGLGIHYH